jgi:hypothetical protein
MANKRELKKALHNMVIDIVDECYTVQLFEPEKESKTEQLIEEAIDFLDTTIHLIYRAEKKADFKPILSDIQEKSRYFTEQLNSLN